MSSRIRLMDMKKGFLAIVLVDLILVGITLVRFPNAGVLRAAPIFILLIGLIFGLVKILPEARSIGEKIGILAGVILGGEVILEYILLPTDNSVYGAVEYGIFAILLIASGVIAYTKYRSLKAGAIAGLWTGLIGSLIWLGIVLTIFHLFWGTPQQTQVFQAEGNYADFASSGMKDFSAFIAQDFFVACFFHLLIGTVVGLILGWIGGLGRSLLRTGTAEIEK